jgi:hypothetical protein
MCSVGFFSIVTDTAHTYADMKDTFEFYKEDLVSDNFLVLESEFGMWRKRTDNNLPSTIDEVLKST